MVEFSPIHPLGDLAVLANQHLLAGQNSVGVSIEIHQQTACAQLFAAKDCETKLANKLKLGTEPGRVTRGENFLAMPLAPGQWMLVANATESDPGKNLQTSLAKSIDGLGYLSQQSDSRICLRLSGPMVAQVMSRGCRLDLHPSQTGPGFCAQTTMAQIGVIIHQLDDQPSYDLYLYAGFAKSFYDWLTHTAAQFGYEVAIK